MSIASVAQIAASARDTLHWAWGMIWNPPLVWMNQDGTFSHTEQVNRFRGKFTRWDMRPLWFHTAFTTKLSCGCRKRLGIKRTIWCMDCCSFELGEDE